MIADFRTLAENTVRGQSKPIRCGRWGIELDMQIGFTEKRNAAMISTGILNVINDKGELNGRSMAVDAIVGVN